MMNKDYVRWVYIAICVPLVLAAVTFFVIIAWEAILGLLCVMLILLAIALVLYGYLYACAGWLWCNSDKTWEQAKREFL